MNDKIISAYRTIIEFTIIEQNEILRKVMENKCDGCNKKSLYTEYIFLQPYQNGTPILCQQCFLSLPTDETKIWASEKYGSYIELVYFCKINNKTLEDIHKMYVMHKEKFYQQLEENEKRSMFYLEEKDIIILDKIAKNNLTYINKVKEII